MGTTPSAHQTWQRIRTNPGPCARSGHAMIDLGGAVYVFGGVAEGDVALNDFWCLRDTRWTLLGSGPPARASAAVCAGPEADEITFVGGAFNSGCTTALADVWTFNVKFRHWTQKTSLPYGIYGATIFWRGDVLYLFGGALVTTYSSDVLIFRANRWRRLLTDGPAPSPRYKHSAVVFGDDLYVFGGGSYCPDEGVLDVHALDLLARRWRRVETHGDLPTGRAAHACCADNDTVYILHGFSGRTRRCHDAFEFDIASSTWTRFAAGGPSPRAFHGACFGEDGCITFGGADGEDRFDDLWIYRARAVVPSLMRLAARATCDVRALRCAAVPREVRQMIFSECR